MDGRQPEPDDSLPMVTSIHSLVLQRSAVETALKPTSSRAAKSSMSIVQFG